MRGLAAFAVILSIFAWKFSFSETLRLYRLRQQNQAQITTSQSAPELLKNMQAKLAQFDAGAHVKPYSHEKLFEETNNFCRDNGLLIQKFFPEIRTISNGIEIVTNHIQVQSGFKAMVRLAHFLEMEQKLGHITSANFTTSEDYRLKQTFLIADFYIQNFIPIKSN
jgi:hypothetical protein